MKFNSLSTFSRWLGSYVFGVLVEEVESPLNGRLQVLMINGRLMLNSENCNLSFKGLHHLFQKVFRHIELDKKPPSNVLLLGMGAGSIPHIIYDELKYKPRMDAVEYDPMIIKLAEKYFDVRRHEKLNIIHADAYDYVLKTKGSYDLITVDLFNDDRVPKKFFDPKFNSALLDRLNKDGKIVFNIMLVDKSYEASKRQLEQFYQKFSEASTSTYQLNANNEVLVVHRN